MTVTKVTVSLDPAVAERARRDVAEGKAKSLSAWVNEAGRARIEGEDLAEVLAELFDETGGPPTEQELARAEQDQTIYRANMLGTLRRRELTRVAGQLSDELGLDYADVRPGERIEGVYRRSIELASGRFAVIEKSREFTLVPWRPVLERSLGRQVSGIAREETISWTLGRQRSGPSIS